MIPMSAFVYQPMTDSRLDPQICAILEYDEASGGAPLETLSPAEARQAVIDGLGPWKGDPEPVASVEDRVIAGPEGTIPIRVYTPEGQAPHPALVYFHGGGWVVCDLDSHDVICRALARLSGAVVVAVDYRLAPEHKFPAAVVDCYGATCWVAANAPSLGIDSRRIAVGGDSAGGNLAAVIALRSRDESGPHLASQVMVYPVTDLSSFETASYREFADGYCLTLAEMEWFRDHYLAKPEDARCSHASPLLEPNLRGLPPALIITAECDPLRDEGEAYGDRLREAGVPVRCTRYAGMIHPFFSYAGAVRQSREAIAEIAATVTAGGLE
jgi:acetyl esterase